MSLPTEIVEQIIEDFISEHTKERTELDSCKFIPQSYLTPLLRVCSIWHEVTERYLYRSIAVGSRIHPLPLPRRRNELVYDFFVFDRKAPVYQYSDSSLKRDGHEFAEGLLATLTSSPRLAALVKTLQLGIELINYQELPEWTQTNIRIMHLCPNLEHVEIRGFSYSELDALVDVLKAKSLVTFCISTQTLERSGFGGGMGNFNFSHVLDMMRKWPRIRSIKVEGYLNSGRAEESAVSIDVAQISERCPELQEIIFTGSSLSDFELRPLRTMCSGVTKFSASIYERRVGGRGNAATNALCECLRAWSSTLECLKIAVPKARNGNRALTKAIARLKTLKELQISGITLELASISLLPRLERYACSSSYLWSEIESLLEDSSRFPSLTCIALYLFDSRAIPERIQNLFARRMIELQDYSRGVPQEAWDADFLL